MSIHRYTYESNNVRHSGDGLILVPRRMILLLFTRDRDRNRGGDGENILHYIASDKRQWQVLGPVVMFEYDALPWGVL